MSRDVFPGFNLKKDGIIWCYQVLDKWIYWYVFRYKHKHKIL
jgi:hypothetical protein